MDWFGIDSYHKLLVDQGVVQYLLNVITSTSEALPTLAQAVLNLLKNGNLQKKRISRRKIVVLIVFIFLKRHIKMRLWEGSCRICCGGR